MALLGRAKGADRTLPVLQYDRCVAKSTDDGRPGLTVRMHCRIVGAVAAALMRRLPTNLREMLPNGVVTLAAVHDVGKVSPGFQKKCLGAYLSRICPPLAELPVEMFRPEHARHAVISEASLKSWLEAHAPREGLATWAEVPGSHHGKHDHSPSPDACEIYGGYGWQKERHALLKLLVDDFGPLPTATPAAEHLLLAAGLTCVADWIGSDERWFPPEGLPEETDLDAIAEKALDEAGWTWPSVRHGLSFGDLFGAEYRPFPMQEVVYEAARQPGLFVVEAPTGLGKTEAALWAAYRLLVLGHHDGLYFGLPTRLTSHRIHLRIEPFLKRAFGDDARARLLHGQAWLTTPDRGGEELRPGGSWFAPSKRGLLLPFGVGTIDQALLGVMQVKHSFMRAFGLAGKIVILDEVHSYDMYTGTLLDELVKLLLRLRCSVFILSATLTQGRREAFFTESATTVGDDYPLITFRHENGQAGAVPAAAPPSREYTVTHAGIDPFVVAESVAQRVGEGQAVLWIMNTVDAAQACYKAAKSCVCEGDGPVGLLHSRFPAWRREELENEWMARLGKGAGRDTGSLLVATQVVEQSVDLDADFLVSELAPTDMVLQRMGRLWRHERPDRPARSPEVRLLAGALTAAEDAPSFKDRLGNSGYVYAPYVLWRSLCVWHQRRRVRLPDEMRALLEATYGDPSEDDPPWVRDLFEHFQRQRAKLSDLAIAATDAGLPALSDHEDARTRYDTAPTCSVLLARRVDDLGSRTELTLADGSELTLQPGRRSFAAAKSLYRNLVSLRTNRHIRCLRESRPPRWLQEHARDGDAVLQILDDGRLTRLNGHITGLAYDNFLGVYTTSTDPRNEEEMTYDESDW